MTEPTDLPQPELEFVFEIRVDTATELPVRTTPGDEFGFIPITGGTVSGPRFTGTVVPHSGGDWATHIGDTWHLDARYALQHDDGSVVEIWNRGYYRDDGYYRCAPTFSTDAPQHAWLTEHQFIGMLRDDDGQICIRTFLLR